MTHREVQAAVDLAGAVDRHDVRMLERRCELGFAQEAVVEALVEREIGRDELQRDGSLQPQVERAVDDAHPAAADLRLDPVAEELVADQNVRHRAPPSQR